MHEFFVEYHRWIITVVTILTYPIAHKIPANIFLRTKVGINPHRKQRARILLNAITTILFVVFLVMLWGIKLKGLLVVGSSLFALLGVALFAAWSLLSNLTSFLILFGQNDCRIGRWIRIIDGANYVEGEITEMGFMTVQLRDHDGNSVLYPNNLFLTRPVVVYKKKPEPEEKLVDDTKSPSSEVPKGNEPAQASI